MAHFSIEQTCNLLVKPRKFIQSIVNDQHKTEVVESKFYDYYEQFRVMKL